LRPQETAQILPGSGQALPAVFPQNKLDDNFHASPVIVGRQLLLRGFKFLYCIEEKP
jgi:hypothetical protein